MAKITKPLTNTEVSQAKLKDKEYNLSDGGGLALRVKPNGTKTWLFNYYHPYTNKRSNISFGTFPIVSLKQARDSRDGSRVLLSQDIDPKSHRENTKRQLQQEHSNTLQKVATEWFAVKETSLTPAYAEDVFRSLTKHIFPSLGKTPITKVNAVDVIKVLKPLSAAGSLETVKRLCQRLNQIMTFAVNTGVVYSNPLAGISKAFEAPIKTNMPTIRPADLPILMKALNTASIKIVTRCLIEWQLHTMVRPGEAAGARWEEIDLNNKLWAIPAKRMKKKREHIVPLTDQAIQLLELIQPISGHREFVFPGDRNPRRHANESTANLALKRMGFHNKLVAHGLRSLASTTLNEQGHDADLIESALAHTDRNSVRGAYNRSEYLERRRSLMDCWSNHIEQNSNGNMSLSNVKTLRIVR
ncbi:integrase domain-containing protein [Glaciecola sp. 33A]|uniref:integrase domain-containing protein n=1 Tax=Glaciecola sp. 33A TaxID=2057807 RepID=UPI000C340865|nr:integrase domain-containing protein [Glaciecola sp. 33A]PKI01909.1 integrase [Glaciecola sp. 33A]